MYLNEIKNRMTFIYKTVYYLELLTHETMIWLESNKNWTTKGKNVENVLHLRINKIALVHRNIINNCYQNNSWVLYTFVLNKLFGQLLGISLKNLSF